MKNGGIYDFSDMKARKKGVYGPKSVFKTLSQFMESGEVEFLGYVIRKKDGSVTAGWSDSHVSEAVGLFSLAKSYIEREWMDP